MFGYVRPVIPELKVREADEYRAVYCSVCYALKKRYGFAARFLVNYDFTLFALLTVSETPVFSKKRCIRHPFKGRRVITSGFEPAADAAVLFFGWKLRDNVRDGDFLKRLTARFLLFAMRKKLRKAEDRLPETAAAAQSCMERLWRLEDEKHPGLDEPADTFAQMLGSLCEAFTGDERRIARELLYNLGRWIYLTDACEDLPQDFKNGGYNPVALRLGLAGDWTDNAQNIMEATLSFSRKRVADAFELLEKTSVTPILQNILTIGLSARENAVFKALKKEENNID